MCLLHLLQLKSHQVSVIITLTDTYGTRKDREVVINCNYNIKLYSTLEFKASGSSSSGSRGSSIRGGQHAAQRWGRNQTRPNAQGRGVSVVFFMSSNGPMRCMKYLFRTAVIYQLLLRSFSSFNTMDNVFVLVRTWSDVALYCTSPAETEYVITRPVLYLQRAPGEHQLSATSPIFSCSTTAPKTTINSFAAEKHSTCSINHSRDSCIPGDSSRRRCVDCACARSRGRAGPLCPGALSYWR